MQQFWNGMKLTFKTSSEHVTNKYICFVRFYAPQNRSSLVNRARRRTNIWCDTHAAVHKHISRDARASKLKLNSLLMHNLWKKIPLSVCVTNTLARIGERKREIPLTMKMINKMNGMHHARNSEIKLKKNRNKLWSTASCALWVIWYLTILECRRSPSQFAVAR